MGLKNPHLPMSLLHSKDDAIGPNGWSDSRQTDRLVHLVVGVILPQLLDDHPSLSTIITSQLIQEPCVLSQNKRLTE